MTYKIIEAVRELIISEDCEKLKVTAEFSDGETRSFHFGLDVTKDTILEVLDRTCENTTNEAAQAEVDKDRIDSEKRADKTAKELLT